MALLLIITRLHCSFFLRLQHFCLTFLSFNSNKQFVYGMLNTCVYTHLTKQGLLFLHFKCADFNYINRLNFSHRFYRKNATRNETKTPFMAQLWPTNTFFSFASSVLRMLRVDGTFLQKHLFTKTVYVKKNYQNIGTLSFLFLGKMRITIPSSISTKLLSTRIKVFQLCNDQETVNSLQKLALNIHDATERKLPKDL